MNIQLSGGNFGGENIQWSTEGTLIDGREFMTIEGLIYVKVSQEQAVFYNVQ